ncbi:Uncharacterised protein [Rothia kristinae]|nr:Uncharacterised protein [Rothia kristinae]
MSTTTSTTRPKPPAGRTRLPPDAPGRIPHREKVLELAEQAAEAVDRDQVSPFATLRASGTWGC